MTHTAIIFDLDGVICHTDNLHYQAWKAVADKEGIYFDELINNRLRGVSRMESLEIILEQHRGAPLDESEKSRMANDKNEIYKSLLNQMDESHVSKEVRKTLDGLRSAGVKLAIGSSSKNAGLILERIKLHDFFDVISDGNDIEFSKPHPQVFLLAAEQLSVHPSQCLVVEDARAGVEAAVCGGFECAGIGDAADDSRVTYSISQLDELLDIVLKNCNSGG